MGREVQRLERFRKFFFHLSDMHVCFYSALDPSLDGTTHARVVQFISLATCTRIQASPFLFLPLGPSSTCSLTSMLTPAPPGRVSTTRCLQEVIANGARFKNCHGFHNLCFRTRCNCQKHHPQKLCRGPAHQLLIPSPHICRFVLFVLQQLCLVLIPSDR